jgi:exosortase K
MNLLCMNRRSIWNRRAQLAVVLLCALALKVFYSAASVDQLRWILAPTTALVELVTGTRFQFESHAGYINSDHTFIIAAACAGVNFLITAFLMLSLRRLWRERRQNQSGNLAWRFIPIAALSAYLATLVANSVRISVALWLQRTPLQIGWLNRNQLHRLEGVFIYFGFLLLLFVISERLSSADASQLSLETKRSRGEPGLFRRSLFPLMIYYLTALGIPLANSAFHRRLAATDFWEHFLFVLLTPLSLVLILAACRLYQSQRPPLQRQPSASRLITSLDG